jgi:hypothetical protein
LFSAALLAFLTYFSFSGTNIVTLFELDERSGTTAINAAINGRDGRYFNEPKLGAPGIVHDSMAVRFRSKTEAHVVVPAHPQLQLREATIGLAFRANSLNGYQGLFAKDQAGQTVAGDIAMYLLDDRLFVRFQSTGRDEVSS